MRLRVVFFFLIGIMLFSCKETEARRPKTKSTTNFYKELIEKNKQLIFQETKFIQDFIKSDTTKVYVSSKKGFWYAYEKKVEENLPKPKLNDIVEIEFNITDFQGNEIYPTQKRKYKVDKEDFIPALQDGIKLMKSGETITFVVPSYTGFGVVGDNNKIKGNQTIKSTIRLININ